MIIKNIFFDANVFNDIFDDKRHSHDASKEALDLAIKAKMKLFTSCDIATNIYYITSKYTNQDNALNAIESIKDIVEIIPFGADELTKAVALMRSDNDYKDFEDTIQYILAQQTNCDIIVTNDKSFVSKDLISMTTEVFVDKIS